MGAPDAAVLGLGYLGRPLAEKLYQQGRRVAALKRHLTSDDINLPPEISLSTHDLNAAQAFDATRWQDWADKPLWFCLLPPSAVADYAMVLQNWLSLAQTFGVQHIIYGSSISVYGDEARLCNEASTLNPRTASAEKVLAAEQLFLNSGIAHIDILRLGGLYSASRHPLTSLLKKSRIGGAQQPVNMLHQESAVAALLHAAAHPAGVRIRNIVSPAHPPKHEFYRAEAAKLGLPEADFDMADTRGGKIVASLYNDFIPQAV